MLFAKSKAYSCSLDIFEDNIGTVDVDHIKTTADNQTLFCKVVSMPLFQGGLHPWIL